MLDLIQLLTRCFLGSLLFHPHMNVPPGPSRHPPTPPAGAFPLLMSAVRETGRHERTAPSFLVYRHGLRIGEATALLRQYRPQTWASPCSPSQRLGGWCAPHQRPRISRHATIEAGVPHGPYAVIAERGALVMDSTARKVIARAGMLANDRGMPAHTAALSRARAQVRVTSFPWSVGGPQAAT